MKRYLRYFVPNFFLVGKLGERLENIVHILHTYLKISAQKMKFSIKDLVTFTGEILNRKLYFLCSNVLESFEYAYDSIPKTRSVQITIKRNKIDWDNQVKHPLAMESLHEKLCQIYSAKLLKFLCCGYFYYTK